MDFKTRVVLGFTLAILFPISGFAQWNTLHIPNELTGGGYDIAVSSGDRINVGAGCQGDYPIVMINFVGPGVFQNGTVLINWGSELKRYEFRDKNTSLDATTWGLLEPNKEIKDLVDRLQTGTGEFRIQVHQFPGGRPVRDTISLDRSSQELGALPCLAQGD